MGYTVEYLDNESIMIVRIEGDFTIEMLQNMFAETAAYIDKNGHIYRVTDCTALELPLQDFMKVLRLAQEAGKSSRGSAADPNVTAVLVGNNQWVSLYRDALRTQQGGGATIPILSTIEDALMYLRLQIERHNNVRDTQETPYIAPQE